MDLFYLKILVDPCVCVKGEVRVLMLFRFCYVIFDGGECMAELTRRGNLTVDETFLRDFCPDLVRGVEKLCQWVNFWKSGGN